MEAVNPTAIAGQHWDLKNSPIDDVGKSHDRAVCFGLWYGAKWNKGMDGRSITELSDWGVRYAVAVGVYAWIISNLMVLVEILGCWKKDHKQSKMTGFSTPSDLCT